MLVYGSFRARFLTINVLVCASCTKGPSRIPAKPFLFDTKIQNTRHIMTSLPQAFTLPTPNHPLPFRHGPFGGTEMPPERE